MKEKADITSPNDQRAKCLDATQNQRVFAMVDFAAMILPASRSCVSLENKTPLISSTPGGASQVKADAPLLLSTGKDDNRRVKDLAYSARANGFFDSGAGFKKLGILTDNCDPTVIEGPDGLKAYLRAVGVTAWSEFVSDCEVYNEERAGPSAVLQFLQAGVSNVILASSYVTDTSFLNAAKAQQFTPKYRVSDFWLVTTDAVANGFDPQEFDRTRAETTYHSGDPSKYAMDIACSKALIDHGLPPITNFAKDGEAASLCENLQLFLQAAARVGSNLTRAGLAEAIQTLGDFHGAVVELARYDMLGKLTGGDAIAPIEWHRECTCWVQIGPYHTPYG